MAALGDAGSAIRIRPLLEGDLDEADRVCRVAFGTFLGNPQPLESFGDAEVVRTRWKADPTAAVAATTEGQLLGSNFATNWGSVGFFGPLTVAPEYWDRRIAQQLLGATLDIFTAWGTEHTGLFTFSHSPKHVGLYQRFGFWPRFLSALMSRPVSAAGTPGELTTLTSLPASDGPGIRTQIRELTEAVHPGLDLGAEIDALMAQRLGDVVLIGDNAGLQAFAVCHVGAGTEAGSGTCYVKFGAARPGPNASRSFSVLIEACDRLATERGVSLVTAGVNAGREEAWKTLQRCGFRTSMLGVTMHRPNQAAYNTARSFVIDDWR